MHQDLIPAEVLQGFRQGPDYQAAKTLLCSLPVHDMLGKEVLNKLIPFMVRQAHHERNQPLAVRPELVEGLIQRFHRVFFPCKIGFTASD